MNGPENRPLLLADIGGTHARFLCARVGDSPPAMLPPEIRLDLRTENFDTFEDLVARALEDFQVSRGESPVAVLALAGPVDDGRARFTNLPWLIDATTLRHAFGFERVVLLNDLAAAARALGGPVLPEHEVLQAGDDGDNRCALVGVGTGLGVAYWRIGERVAEASEAGHAGFAVAGDWQMSWLAHLQAKLGRVSWERTLSGDGLAELDAWLRDGERDEVPNVVQRAHAGSPSAQMALRLFSELLGVFAGDLVLAAPAPGGIWLTGGVLRGLDRLFDTRAFLAGFAAKGRMSDRMQSVAVRWIREGDLGLRGCWLAAVDLSRDALTTA